MKPGYKMTEVGVVPEDWEVTPLSSTAKKIVRGASPRPIDSPVWFDSLSTVGWVRISDITRSGRYLTHTTQHLSEEGIRRSRPVPSGSLIMSICATVGRPIETQIDTCIHDGFVVFEQPSIDQSYLYYVLTALELTWSKHGQTGSQMNLNTGLINNCLIPLPPIKTEQHAIATVLSDMDALLDGLDKLIAKKRDLKQAAMQQLLTGQTRLPGFSGEWEVKLVKDFGEIVTGGTPSIENKEFWGEGYPWITPTDISTDRDMVTSERMITEEGLKKIRLLPANTVLVTCIASIGKNAILRAVGGCNQQINAIIPNDDNCVEFIYYLMEANKQYLLSNAGTTATAILSKAIFSELEFLVPVKSEQTAIATVLSDIDAELEALETRRSKTHALKQAMMQELLTGRIRLVKAQKGDAIKA